jgi:hypothetical protein
MLATLLKASSASSSAFLSTCNSSETKGGSAQEKAWIHATNDTTAR